MKIVKTMNVNDRKYLLMAIDIARVNITSGGGPFGAVVVRGEEILSCSGNRVVPECDPTAHAEISAIREAASLLKTFDLGDCTIYASCEPCPMCLGAIYWSGIKRVVFASDRYSAASAGFSDEMIYNEIILGNHERTISMEQGLSIEGEKVFEVWAKFPGKIPY
jgi:guanine deaminase